MTTKGNQTLLPLPQGEKPATIEEIPPELRAVFCEWRMYSEEMDFAALPKKITYLLTASGTRVVRKTPVGIVIEELEGEPLIPLPLLNLDPGLMLSVPRVPWEVLRSVVAFFRQVGKEMKTEALVRIYRHKVTGEWELQVPTQEVGPGSVKVDEKWVFDAAGEYIHIMDIHSHVDMPAFFSGTDDADEKRAVRLYGVIGKISSPQPHSSWRMWTGFDFMELSLTDVVAIPTAQLSFPVKRSLSAILEGNEESKKVQVDISNYDPFQGATFPAEWMKAISERHVTVFQNWQDMEDYDARSFMGFTGRPHEHNPSGAYTPRHWHGGPTHYQGNGKRDAFLTPAPPQGRFAQLKEAAEFAQLHTKKLVYIVLGNTVTRVLPDGETKKTKMSYANVAAMKNQRGDEVRIFDLTPPLGGD
jgi:PRTRC genetic system protein A